jgi:hypothetical protein
MMTSLMIVLIAYGIGYPVSVVLLIGMMFPDLLYTERSNGKYQDEDVVHEEAFGMALIYAFAWPFTIFLIYCGTGFGCHGFRLRPKESEQ